MKQVNHYLQKHQNETVGLPWHDWMEQVATTLDAFTIDVAFYIHTLIETGRLELVVRKNQIHTFRIRDPLFFVSPEQLTLFEMESL